MKIIYKSQEWYLENKREIDNMRDYTVDYDVMHTMSSRMMRSMQ